MNKLTVLLIEDDEIEQMKFQRIVQKQEISHHICIANQGEQALEMLLEEQLLPDIILLDLHMPKINGIDFLQKIRTVDHLAYIPIIVLTTSANPSDIQECYKQGASGYIIKPLEHEHYRQKINALIAYWQENEIVKGHYQN